MTEPWGAALFGDPCRACGFDWSIAPEEAVGWVAGLDDHLAALAASQGTKRRAQGGWSVTEYVCHVGDNLRQWAERVQGARLSGCRDVVGYDPDALAAARGYAGLSVGAAVWSTGLAAAAWVSVLESALAEDVELHHATRGLQRAEDVARNNCHDAYHHLWDIQSILDEQADPGLHVAR